MNSWLSTLDVSDMVLNSILALALMVVVVSAWRFHKDKRFKAFNLFKLITHPDGSPSRPAIQEFGVFTVMTWGFILLINKNALTEWFVVTYVGAFVLRAAHSAYLNSKSGNENGKGEKK